MVHIAGDRTRLHQALRIVRRGFNIFLKINALGYRAPPDWSPRTRRRFQAVTSGTRCHRCRKAQAHTSTVMAGKISGEEVAQLIETTEQWTTIAGNDARKDMLFGKPRLEATRTLLCCCTCPRR